MNRPAVVATNGVLGREFHPCTVIMLFEHNARVVFDRAADPFPGGPVAAGEVRLVPRRSIKFTGPDLAPS